MIEAGLIARARDIDLVATAERLGAALKRVSATELAGPCLVCNGRDRFSVNRKRKTRWPLQALRDAGGDGMRARPSCSRDPSSGEAVAYLTGENTSPTPARVRPSPEPKDNGDNREKALTLWRRRRPVVEGDPVWRYLRYARGYGGSIPATLGFLPARQEHPPCMLAAIGLAGEPEPGVIAIRESALRRSALDEVEGGRERKGRGRRRQGDDRSGLRRHAHRPCAGERSPGPSHHRRD